MKEKAFDYCLETFEEIAQRFEDEYGDLSEAMDKANAGGEIKEQINALKDLSVHFGKMKMLNEVMCFMRRSLIEVNNANI